MNKFSCMVIDPPVPFQDEGPYSKILLILCEVLFVSCAVWVEADFVFVCVCVCVCGGGGGWMGGGCVCVCVCACNCILFINLFADVENEEHTQWLW